MPRINGLDSYYDALGPWSPPPFLGQDQSIGSVMGRVGIPGSPPSGFIWLLGSDGQYLKGADGAFLYGVAP